MYLKENNLTITFWYLIFLWSVFYTSMPLCGWSGVIRGERVGNGIGRVRGRKAQHSRLATNEWPHVHYELRVDVMNYLERLILARGRHWANEWEFRSSHPDGRWRLALTSGCGQGLVCVVNKENYETMIRPLRVHPSGIVILVRTLLPDPDNLFLQIFIFT